MALVSFGEPLAANESVIRSDARMLDLAYLPTDVGLSSFSSIFCFVSSRMVLLGCSFLILPTRSFVPWEEVNDRLNILGNTEEKDRLKRATLVERGAEKTGKFGNRKERGKLVRGFTLRSGGAIAQVVLAVLASSGKRDFGGSSFC